MYRHRSYPARENNNEGSNFHLRPLETPLHVCCNGANFDRRTCTCFCGKIKEIRDKKGGGPLNEGSPLAWYTEIRGNRPGRSVREWVNVCRVASSQFHNRGNSVTKKHTFISRAIHPVELDGRKPGSFVSMLVALKASGQVFSRWDCSIEKQRDGIT
jgi:hypothetical protein